MRVRRPDFDAPGGWQIMGTVTSRKPEVVQTNPRPPSETESIAQCQNLSMRIRLKGGEECDLPLRFFPTCLSRHEGVFYQGYVCLNNSCRWFTPQRGRGSIQSTEFVRNAAGKCATPCSAELQWSLLQVTGGSAELTAGR